MLLQARRAGQDRPTRQMWESKESTLFQMGSSLDKERKHTELHYDITRKIVRLLVMRSQEHVRDEPMVSQQISDIKTQRREGLTTQIQKIYLKTCICNSF